MLSVVPYLGTDVSSIMFIFVPIHGRMANLVPNTSSHPEAEIFQGFLNKFYFSINTANSIVRIYFAHTNVISTYLM